MSVWTACALSACSWRLPRLRRCPCYLATSAERCSSPLEKRRRFHMTAGKLKNLTQTRYMLCSLLSTLCRLHGGKTTGARGHWLHRPDPCGNFLIFSFSPSFLPPALPPAPDRSYSRWHRVGPLRCSRLWRNDRASGLGCSSAQGSTTGASRLEMYKMGRRGG